MLLKRVEMELSDLASSRCAGTTAQEQVCAALRLSGNYMHRGLSVGAAQVIPYGDV